MNLAVIPVAIECQSEGPRVLLADGEKLSADQINSTHVPHPGVAGSFRRSTLLVGTRGAGKTFLLRHRKIAEHRGAVYVNLVSCLQSISRDSGFGGRTLTFTENQRSQICAKAGALVAITVVEQLLRDGRLLALDEFLLEHFEPVPANIRGTGSVDLESIRSLRLHVNKLRLREWPTDLCKTWLLSQFLQELNERCEPPLELFLDRAEDAPAPALKPLLSLLDQSTPFLTVIAARPGLAQLVPTELDPTLVPGSHFDIVHIGADPYDIEWKTFSEQAVRNFLNANGVDLTGMDSLSWASRFGRDSIRDAVNLAQIGLDVKGDSIVERRAGRLAAYRDHQLATIRAELQPEHPDYELTIRKIRHYFRKELRTSGPRPVLIDLQEKDEQLALLQGQSATTRFLLKAIRCEALYLPPGYVWHPFELPTVFEVPPRLVWNQENTAWIV